jgi:hypothetical protein
MQPPDWFEENYPLLIGFGSMTDFECFVLQPFSTAEKKTTARPGIYLTFKALMYGFFSHVGPEWTEALVFEATPGVWKMKLYLSKELPKYNSPPEIPKESHPEFDTSKCSCKKCAMSNALKNCNNANPIG